MKSILIIFLIFVHMSVVWADAPKYLIVFSDGSEDIYYIVNNDPFSKRLQIQRENDVKQKWISYYRISRIVDSRSQKDVTEKFIKFSPRHHEYEAISKATGDIVIAVVAALLLFALFGIALTK